MKTDRKAVSHCHLFSTTFAILVFLVFSSCGFFSANTTLVAQESRFVAVEDAEPIASVKFDYEQEFQGEATYVTPSRENAPVLPQDQSVRVPPELTNWGEPWNHRDICARMDAILFECGVESAQARVRMIAHAIVASGWRQNVWNFNAWGVQLGSWDGPWFIKSTYEVNEYGDFYTVWTAAWRSFSSWQEAVEDYQRRISSGSKRDSYRTAYAYLNDPDPWADISFWSALKEGRYYTDHRFTGRKFAVLCKRVRQELSEHYAGLNPTSIYSRKI
jgi:hypothetical protein